jgi:hypothetical protein
MFVPDLIVDYLPFQIHAAAGTGIGFVTVNIGVHRAGIVFFFVSINSLVSLTRIPRSIAGNHCHINKSYRAYRKHCPFHISGSYL